MSDPYSKLHTGVLPSLLCTLLAIFSLPANLNAQETGTWTTQSTQGATVEARHENAFVRVGERFYLLGGRGTTTIQVYDPATKRWSNTGTKLDNIHHFQAHEYGGKIYLIGALTGNYPNEDPLPNILIYDPARDALTTGATIPAGRRRGSSGVAFYNGNFYIVAGNRNGHSAFLDNSSTPANVAWVDKYDPRTNTWTVLPDAPHARDHFFAEVIGNRLYVAGGRRSKAGTPQSVWSDTEVAVDVFDLVSERWLTGAEVPNPLPTARAGAATAVLNDELLLIGGEISSNPPDNLALPHTEIFNPATGRWRRDANLGLQRHGTQAIVYNDDVYLAAGSKTKGGTNISPSEAFLEKFTYSGNGEETYPSWTNVNTGPIAKSEAGMVTYRGEYYIVHGFTRYTKLAHTVEKYNPATNTWTSLTPMPAAEAVTHNGIAIVGDDIWVVGGRLGDHPGAVTDQVWIYSIPSDSWSRGPTLPLPAGGGGMGLLGRELHYVGGFDEYAECDRSTHLVYDLDNPGEGWQDRTAVSPMPLARNHFGAVTFAGKLYTVGGQNGHDGCRGGLDNKHVHVYDPITDEWKRLADLPEVQSHAEPSTFVHNNKILVVGGANSGGDDVWEYDPVTDRWTVVERMRLPVALLAPAVRVYDGRMVVMNGGQPSATLPIDVTRTKDFAPTTDRTLAFNPGTLNLTLGPNQATSQPVILANLNGEERTPFQLNAAALPSWLTLKQSGDQARESITEINLTASSVGLSEGTYSFMLEATASGYQKAQLRVNLKVEGVTPNPSGAFSQYLEAECATVGTNWLVQNSPLAGGGSYVVLSEGIDRSVEAPPAATAANQVSFSLNVPRSGNYGIHARILTRDAQSDSFWVRINGGEWQQWWEGIISGSSFGWFQILNQPFALPAGRVRIDVAYRETGVVLDKIYVTDSGTLPSGKGGQASNCATSPPPPPPPPTGNDFSAYLEAECGIIGSNWVLGSDAAASQGQYAVAKTGIGATLANPPAATAANRISFSLQVPASDDYHLFARLKAPSGASDSYWVRINGGPWLNWWEGNRTGDVYGWREVISSPYALPAGTVTIDVAYREPGTQLDKLFFTNTDAVPTGMGGSGESCGVASTVAIRINAGGPTVVHGGQQFVNDTYHTGGESNTRSSASVADLYKTERSARLSYGYNYSIPVPDGDYLVRLHFAEIYYGSAGVPGGAGQRVFDVSLEDQLILDNYDIIADVGTQKVTIKEFPVTVRDGAVSLLFDASKAAGGSGQPTLSALEVVSRGNPSPAPPVAAYFAEAECATGGSQWAVPSSSTASEGRYAVFNGSNILSAPDGYGGSGQLTWSLNLTREAIYHLFLRMDAPSPSSNSFWVSVDDQPWMKFWHNIQSQDILTNGFEWHKVQDNGFDVTFPLTVGPHTIRVAAREPGTGLDKIYLSSSPTPPVGQGAAALACATARSGVTGQGQPQPALAEADLRLFPNPVSRTLNYRMQTGHPGTYRLQVTDFTGRLLREETTEVQVAEETVTGNLEVGDWPAGTYRLRVIDVEGGTVSLSSFVKLR